MAGDTEEALRLRGEVQLPEEQVTELRDRYYWHWQTYERERPYPRDTWPFYSLWVRSEAARTIVLAAIPDRTDVAVGIHPEAGPTPRMDLDPVRLGTQQ